MIWQFPAAQLPRWDFNYSISREASVLVRARAGIVSQAGGMALVEAMRAGGLDTALSAAAHPPDLSPPIPTTQTPG